MTVVKWMQIVQDPQHSVLAVMSIQLATARADEYRRVDVYAMGSGC